MSTIDMTHRKLNFPPRFLPYLEKHRIFELFHECVELLVQVRPRDHIQFLKNVLPCAAMKKDKQRIVFLSPPSFDAALFSKLLADCLGIQAITNNLLDLLTREKLDAAKIQTLQVVEEEEESCICPAETSPLLPLYYPQGGEVDYYFGSIEGGQEEEDDEEEEEEEEAAAEGKEEKPCICVCPCIQKEREAAAAAAATAAAAAAASASASAPEPEPKPEPEPEPALAESAEEGEGGEGEYYPCKPSKRKRKPYKELISTTSEAKSSLSAIEVDYGILAECEQSAKGWILEDYAKTEEEAEKLNALGVIPTHAVRIIVDEEIEEKDRNYKAIVKGWMRAYKYVPVVEIRVGKRVLPELVKDMCTLLSVMPHRHAPMLPRVVLIGSRGAGVTTQGEKLARKYGLVHVEFDLVISRALQQDDEICKMYKLQLATRPDPELEALLLERALLTPMCRNRGWVLTGYPTNIDQMRMLDIIATPPNRVIFIEVPARECFVRLYYRKIDSWLGDEYKIPVIQPAGLDTYETPDLDVKIANRLQSHPRNNKKQIISDIEHYFLCKPDMMRYCGKTASIINGNQEVDRVFEQIEQVLINPAPAQPPRDPLAINYGIADSYERLKKFRLAPGMFFNNMLLNPPRQAVRI